LIPLPPVLEECLQLLRPLIPDTIKIAQHIGQKCPAVLADAAQIQQAVRNLCLNAWHSLPEGTGQISVRLDHCEIDPDQAAAHPLLRAGPQVRLSIRDSGPGLTKDVMGRIFEPFAYKQISGKSSGLALFAVQEIAHAHEGAVTVESAPGEGTAFDVTLPLANGAAAPAPASAAPDSAQAPWSEPRHERAGSILYIEDNQVNVLLVEELVKSVAGLDIASEPTGAAGVARARTMRPDLVLIDLQLPDFDGFEVLRRLRAEPGTRAIPCIALSANAMPEDIDRGMAAGFADYWTKPIDFAAFLTALKKRFPAAHAATAPTP
jgi:CheY-like chemotaxis protein